MRIKITGIILLMLSASCSGQPVVQRNSMAGEVYYVAVSGNDSYSGTQAAPWKTIQKAANTLAAGDTVIVLAGDYSSQRVTISKSGTSTTPITYKAEGQVVTKGFNISASYIVLDGFEAANTDYQRWGYSLGAGIYNTGSYNLLTNNYIHDTPIDGIYLGGSNNQALNNRVFQASLAGIEVYGSNNLIQGNEVWGTIQCPAKLRAVESTCNASIGFDADGMRFFGSGHIFRKNYTHDLKLGEILNGVNVNPDPHIDCFQTFSSNGSGAGKNITFEQNYCVNYDGTSAFMLSGGADHLYIRNNIFKTATGISANGNGAGGSDYLYIYNNLWVGQMAAGATNYPEALKFENIAHVYVENNIFYDQGYKTAYFLGDTSNIIFDYNLTYNSNGTKQHCINWGDYNTCLPSAGHNQFDIDPRFVDPADKDYHLKSSSPAIDAGDDLGNLVPNDNEGITRPQGIGYDIGPYEYNLAVSTPLIR